MKPIRLQVNHRANPFGIDDKSFRFTWNNEGGVTQTAYRVICKTENGVLHDSGIIKSSSMHYTAALNLKSGKHEVTM
ncbi:MAG: hypothetical protein IKS12_07100 [Eubacterium sp.]|nr:hypothetical protein [Eubacterium sp.]